MRIALLDPPGFTPPYDHSLAASLAARGHDVHLLTAPDLHGSAREPDGYTRHEVYLPWSSALLRRRPRAGVRRYVKAAEYPLSVRRAERLLDRIGPDMAHVQWLPSPRHDVRWLARVVGRYPTVFTAHDVFTRRPRSAEAWGAALGLADRVVVHSDRAVKQLEEIGVARRRLVRILHPVFVDGAAPAETDEPHGRTLLFFGLVRHYKGLDVLLRALPEIVGQVPGARLVVAGEPLEPAAPLLALAEELDLNGTVEWRLHFVREPELAELFAGAACAVLPYRELDSSGVLATALGHGRPAVVTDVGSLGTIVREFGAGRVVPPEDPAALAAACVELLSDESRLAEAAAGARAARGSLTWDAAAAEHERAYEELLRERA
jgi:glycosyltransferase involved in cell wall biosynthesis